MKYAVIDIQGKQYRVQEGEQLVLDRLAENAFTKGKLTVEQVLLVRTDKDVKVGAPYVKGAKVSLKHVQDQRGEKIDVRQYKAKSRYRRHMGHRQAETLVEVAEIAA